MTLVKNIETSSLIKIPQNENDEITDTAISDIESKEKLLFKSYKNSLITEYEFVEKNNKLKDDKIKLIDKRYENNMKSIALKNISEKIKDLKELQNQGLINEAEYTVKYESLLSIEINSIREQQK